MSRKRVEIPATSISCQITEAERDALPIVAAQFDFSNVAEFVRFCIINTCEGELQAAQDFLVLTADLRRSKNAASVQN